MPKTIWQKKMAARKTTVHWLSEPKQAATVAAHQTIARGNLRLPAEKHAGGPVGNAQHGGDNRHKNVLVELPLKPSARQQQTNIETPMAIQMEEMARPIVVPGLRCGWFFCLLRMMAQHSSQALIMVTSQAQGQWL